MTLWSGTCRQTRRFRRAILRVFTEDSFEGFFSILCVLAALPIVLSPGHYAPQSVYALLPIWFVTYWGVTLLLGGVLVFCALLWQSLRIEQAGLALLGAGAFIFAIALGTQVPWDGRRLLGIFTYVAFACTCVGRFHHLTRVVSAIQHSRQITLRDDGDEFEG